MVNENKQVVCDYSNVILNDGVTIFPGYVEIRNRTLIRWDSDDPMNELAKQKPWILHNRVEYARVAFEEPCDSPKLRGKHFISRKAMDAYMKECLDKKDTK
jgi:hypothetical protein